MHRREFAKKKKEDQRQSIGTQSGIAKQIKKIEGKSSNYSKKRWIGFSADQPKVVLLFLLVGADIPLELPSLLGV